jgi:eukaryotic-like serine/threonine-protein kinase
MSITGERRAAPDPLIGRVIADKFRLRECVGMGASGSVYKADQMALDRTVAIKVLNQDLATDDRLVRRFQDEAMAASRLNHPNTVSIIDYGQTEDGLLYLAMEFLNGRTLTQMIQREMPFGPAWVADTLGQILAGLEEAHAGGVVHADMKSDNIVIEHRRGGWDLAKVVDFGIARILGAPRSDPGERSICGTPEYMAPEVIGGADPTFASDLYGVGVILYEMLTGSTPFAGGSTVDILTRHLYEAPERPRERVADPAVDPDLESCALRALAKKPADRFPSATAFRQAVAEIAARATAQAAGAIRCDACGAASAVPFKFCPECGHPRERSHTVELPSLHSATAPTADVSDMVREAAREWSDDSAGGLFPLPLVGREPELDQLTRFFVNEGAAMLQVVGGPGSGRSRLITEAYIRLAEVSRDVIIYHAAPDPSGLAATFYPIRSIVAAVLGLPPMCPYDGLGDALEAIGLSRRDLPGIAELFGHRGELWQLEPPVRRRELIAATVRVLRAAASRGPAVLVFEDVDQYDQPSQELLRRLAERTDSHPLRVVVSNGVEFAERWPQAVVRLDLQPLDRAPVEQLTGHLRARAPEAMPDAATLERLTGGNLARITHLVRYLVEGGSLEHAPESLGDLIAARLGLLPRNALLLCQGAAVFGCEVGRELLRTVLRKNVDEASGLSGSKPGEAFERALEAVCDRGLLVESDGRLSFHQALVRDVCYDATPADVRRTLHECAVQALQTDSASAAVLGHHHEMAGHRAQAAELLMLAGDGAVHQLDDIGASTLYQRAMAAARQVLLADDDADNRIRFVTLSVRLADVLRVGGEVALARGVVEEARGYCGDAPVLEAQLLRASSHLSLAEGDTSGAVSTVRRALGLAIPSGNMELIAELYLDLSHVHLRNGSPEVAMAELEEAVDLLTLGEGIGAEGGPEAMWRLLLRMAQLGTSLADGDLEQRRAVTLGEAALRQAQRVRSRLGMARVQSMLASLYEKVGDREQVERCRAAAVAEMRNLGDRRGTAELLLAGIRPTRTLMRIDPSTLREAAVLAAEVGWQEGVDQARRRGGS